MADYIKIIGLTGSIYVKEYEKIKHHKNKLRELNEDTVAHAFRSGKASVCVRFEETGVEVELDAFSDDADIQKYLGKAFLSR